MMIKSIFSKFFFLTVFSFLFISCAYPANSFDIENDSVVVIDKFDQVPGTVIVHSPKSSGIYRGTPSLVKLPNGHIIASNDVFGKGVKNSTDIFISVDDGDSWVYVSTLEGAVWSGLFHHDGVLYLLGADTGSGPNLVIRGSSDEGKSWSSPTVIVSGPCHGSATPVVFANDRVYKAYEFHDKDNNNKWMSGNESYIISAHQNSNLLDPTSWSQTDAVRKPAWLDGTGWLETNAVLGKDGKIKGISRLASMEGIYAGYYSLENDTKIESNSLRKIQFWGGSSKFTIRYDSVTNRYWSLTNYVPSKYSKGNRSAGGVRNTLALISSKDLEEWKINSIVLSSPDVDYVGFQYVDWVFDSNDIILVSRTSYDDGMGGAQGFHDANFMTFHRIKDYSTVAISPIYYDLLPNGEWNGIVKEIDTSNEKGNTKDNPILISDPGELVYISEQVYQGNTYENIYFKMTNNIDLNNYNFLPIGWYATMSQNRPFSGHFNGAGHMILNLKINRNDGAYTSNGLFGYALNATIKNIGVAGNILTGGVVGGVVAYSNESSILSSYNNVNVRGTSQVGGILGFGIGLTEVSNCYNTGEVYLSSSGENKYAGGIIGYLRSGKVKNSYNVGDVSSLTPEASDGLIGYFNEKPINSYYLSESVVNGKGKGIEIMGESLKSAIFVPILNAAQDPLQWKFNSNNGFPKLYWE